MTDDEDPCRRCVSKEALIERLKLAKAFVEGESMMARILLSESQAESVRLRVFLETSNREIERLQRALDRRAADMEHPAVPEGEKFCVILMLFVLLCWMCAFFAHE